ncbi:MAG: sigma-70 family RNA polymerase sigma factor [Saprospiraceae bacterium]|nr:sigma-70 family RNA polymerase sigma factor [Saprospiraceae bacterium]
MTVQITELILEGCRRQERPAQAALYRQCSPALMRVALRYARNADDAADILNRGFFKVFTKIDQFAGTAENFGGWIRRIIINEALDFVRADPGFSGHEALEAAAHIGASPDVEHIEAAQSILRLLRRLPLTTATVFNLFAMEGFSHQEISEQLGITETNSKWHLHSARQKLQQLLRQTIAL